VSEISTIRATKKTIEELQGLRKYPNEPMESILQRSIKALKRGKKVAA
jgi:hypothetical protein